MNRTFAALEGAACAASTPGLFESTLRIDHEEARKWCRTCPAFAVCHALLTQELVSYPNHGGGPVGTWAGQLVGVGGRGGRRK